MCLVDICSVCVACIRLRGSIEVYWLVGLLPVDDIILYRFTESRYRTCIWLGSLTRVESA